MSFQSGERFGVHADPARLYGVTMARLDEQVSPNRERLPEDFAYQLTRQEFTVLISQNVISTMGVG